MAKQQSVANVRIARPGQTYSVEESDVLWSPQPGQQTELMRHYEFETLIGGHKGSGKSFCAIGWMIRGNDVDPNDPNITPTDVLYINNPNFRGAVIRKNIDDLDDWVDKATPVYAAFGAKLTKQPYEFNFPSGAKIVMYHMADSESYMRVTGKMTIRLFWDELTFEPDLNKYIKVFSSIRSGDKQMIPQILCASNPEGPGLRWVKDRFVKARDKSGKPVAPGKVFEISSWDPIQKKSISTQRIFLPWVLDQNRKLLDNDPTYAARLSSIPNEALRKAYLYGDWDAAGGQVFGTFRPNGPMEEEPPNARHVYEEGSEVIQPWWPHYVSMDWGYKHHAAAFKFAVSPRNRLFVYDEKIVSGLGSREWGAAIARWCISELSAMERIGVQPSMQLFLSPDAIGKRDDAQTPVEWIQAGIDDVLGADSSELLESFDTNLKHFEGKELQNKAKITIRPAKTQRVFGVNYIHELFRFTKIVDNDFSQYNQEEADRILYHDGASKYFKYMDLFLNIQKEDSPKMLISSKCRRLIETIPSLGANPNNLEDVLKTETVEDDIFDGWRYGCVAHIKYSESSRIPDAVRLEEKMVAVNPENKMNQFSWEQQLKKNQMTVGFRIGRGANRRVTIM